MPFTRRKLLETLALTGVSTLLPRLAFPQQPGPDGGFPPQAQIDADPLRPRYHLAPKRGWMNDPCAPVYFDGRYHLFYQFNPQASVWGNMSWAHAVSTDMVHWTERPLALERTPGGPDAYGVFTGSMVFDKGVPTILYTCVSPSTKEQSTLWASNPPEREAQCLAVPAASQRSKAKRPGGPLAQNVVIQGPYSYSSADGPDGELDLWIKNPTPVIPAPPAGMHVTGFRDPVPWREDDGNFYLLLASGQKGIGGNVLLYKSPDLKAWQYQGIFAQGKPTGKQTDDTVDSGETWECPDFFPLGSKHVLIHSQGTLEGRKTMWQSGTLDKTTMKWTPEKEGVLNHGPYYAPKTQLDAHGNRILWGWIPEEWPEAEMTKHGWSGCMSLPRIMTLDRNGEARFTPAPACSTLRGPRKMIAGTPPASNDTVEIELHLEPVGQSVINGGTSAPQRLVTPRLVVDTAANPQDRALVADGKSQTISLLVDKEIFDLPANSPLEIRCFIDHSLVEIFLGNHVVVTRRVYDGSPTKIILPSTFRIKSSIQYPIELA